MKLGKLSSNKQYTLGTDPEIFAMDKGKLLPAFEFLPPKTAPDTSIYWDGFQAEFKLDYVPICQNNLVQAVREQLMALDLRVKKHSKTAKLSLVNVLRIPDEMLKKAAYEHVQLGCEPSFNAYGLEGKIAGNPRELKFRCVGGHMHFGTWNVRPKYDRMAKFLDKILGVWSVGAAQALDSRIRREYYGLPGEHRRPIYGKDGYGKNQYGFEYRSLSNFWLANPATMQATWDIGRLAVKLASSRYGHLWEATDEEVTQTMLECDVDRANAILKRNQEMFKWMLKHQWTYNPKDIDLVFKIAKNGIREVVEDPHDIPTNWHFRKQWEANATLPWARFGRQYQEVFDLNGNRR